MRQVVFRRKASGNSGGGYASTRAEGVKASQLEAIKTAGANGRKTMRMVEGSLILTYGITGDPHGDRGSELINALVTETDSEITALLSNGPLSSLWFEHYLEAYSKDAGLIAKLDAGDNFVPVEEYLQYCNGNQNAVDLIKEAFRGDRDTIAKVISALLDVSCKNNPKVKENGRYFVFLKEDEDVAAIASEGAKITDALLACFPVEAAAHFSYVNYLPAGTENTRYNIRFADTRRFKTDIATLLYSYNLSNNEFKAAKTDNSTVLADNYATTVADLIVSGDKQGLLDLNKRINDRAFRTTSDLSADIRLHYFLSEEPNNLGKEEIAAVLEWFHRMVDQASDADALRRNDYWPTVNAWIRNIYLPEVLGHLSKDENKPAVDKRIIPDTEKLYRIGVQREAEDYQALIWDRLESIEGQIPDLLHKRVLSAYVPENYGTLYWNIVEKYILDKLSLEYLVYDGKLKNENDYKRIHDTVAALGAEKISEYPKYVETFARIHLKIKKLYGMSLSGFDGDQLKYLLALRPDDMLFREFSACMEAELNESARNGSPLKQNGTQALMVWKWYRDHIGQNRELLSVWKGKVNTLIEHEVSNRMMDLEQVAASLDDSGYLRRMVRELAPDKEEDLKQKLSRDLEDKVGRSDFKLSRFYPDKKEQADHLMGILQKERIRIPDNVQKKYEIYSRYSKMIGEDLQGKDLDRFCEDVRDADRSTIVKIIQSRLRNSELDEEAGLVASAMISYEENRVIAPEKLINRYLGLTNQKEKDLIRFCKSIADPTAGKGVGYLASRCLYYLDSGKRERELDLSFSYPNSRGFNASEEETIVLPLVGMIASLIGLLLAVWFLLGCFGVDIGIGKKPPVPTVAPVVTEKYVENETPGLQETSAPKPTDSSLSEPEPEPSEAPSVPAPGR